MGTAKTFMLLAALTALFMAVGYLIGGVLGMAIAFVAAAGMNVFSWWNADKIVLRMQGAKEVTPETSSPMLRTFAGDVARMAERAGLPAPRVYIIETPQPNAFATGRNPENAAVAATSGLLGSLTREEVAGVMAHELAHVRNRDTLTMTVTATMAGLLPIMWGEGTGSEVMKRIAAPMVGGMVSATLLNLIVLPALYAIVLQFRFSWMAQKLVAKNALKGVPSEEKELIEA